MSVINRPANLFVTHETRHFSWGARRFNLVCRLCGVVYSKMADLLEADHALGKHLEGHIMEVLA